MEEDAIEEAIKVISFYEQLIDLQLAKIKALEAENAELQRILSKDKDSNQILR
jgi:hypothetical protein